jgi:hypothetical protein
MFIDIQCIVIVAVAVAFIFLLPTGIMAALTNMMIGD